MRSFRRTCAQDCLPTKRKLPSDKLRPSLNCG